MASPPAVVTGVPGWLGNRLLQVLLDGLPDGPELLLADDREIRLLVNGANSSFVPKLEKNKRVKTVVGDLREKSSLESLLQDCRGGTVFHLAGVIHPSRVRDFFEINTNGTGNLLDLAIKAKIRRFIYISSNSPIGVNPDHDHLFDENTPYNPYMNYGQSKMLAEKKVQAAGRQIETVILRPPWFYGPGQPPRQNLFFTMIKNGTVPVVGDGENRRSMAYLDNICQAMLLAEKVDRAKSQIYWIADRQPYTMNQIIETIETLLESEFSIAVAGKRRHLPNLASDTAYLVDSALQSLGIYHQKIHVLSEMNKDIACSIAKAENELGYDPKISLAEGMRRSIRWVLEQGTKL